MDKEDMLVPQEGDVLLCVSITKSMKSGERGSLYEATRKWWRLSPKTVQDVTHVLGVYEGEVKVVYDDVVWQLTADPRYAGRLEFTSAHPDGVKSDYIGKYYRMRRPTVKLRKENKL
ncbi:MAG: hypothetical protein IAC51_00270 [bacterium]|uniref:Uncharacterized protein n=1 Tax=Candidatus Aphodosoma intestinipullorum TaxID=2840674 RepID=A0A940DI58_9BACT|nr:hypothetical protein [Candidatus Aphodosoma intestinipullorum]